MLFELLPIELRKAQLHHFFTTQLSKGITLSEILPAVETSSIAPIRHAIQGAQEEADYLKIKRMLSEADLWLTYLVEARKTLLPQEERELLRIQTELAILTQALEPLQQKILKKREHENRDFEQRFYETLEEMKTLTDSHVQQIVVEFEKFGEKKHALMQAMFDQFFKGLKEEAEKILAFIGPKLLEWNRLVLETAKGFYLDASTSGLPCSLLFAFSGSYYFLFESGGHLLGLGADKLVFRAICLPKGEIHAVIRPLYHKKVLEDASQEKKDWVKAQQFHNMWQETEMLMQLKGRQGIVDLKERMVIPFNEGNALFLAEDYYWDGSLASYLKYPIQKKIASAKLTKQDQFEVLMDLALGLEEVHRQGILHHDIKPDNILLDLRKKRSKAVLADFHLASYLTHSERLKELMLLPKWASPEYAKACLNQDTMPPQGEAQQAFLATKTVKLDIWCLGVVFYCLIAYELPFWVGDEQEKEPYDLMAKRVFPQQASLTKGWLPAPLKSSPYFPLLERMLDPDPAGRCTAEEVVKLLKNMRF